MRCLEGRWIPNSAPGALITWQRNNFDCIVGWNCQMHTIKHYGQDEGFIVPGDPRLSILIVGDVLLNVLI